MNINHIIVVENKSRIGGYLVKCYESLAKRAETILVWHFSKLSDAIDIAGELRNRHNAESNVLVP